MPFILLKAFLINLVGNYMLKTIMGWFMPTIIEKLGDMLQEYIDDPDTETDNDLVDKVEKFAQYYVDKKIG